MKILTITGSLAKNSINKKLYALIKPLAPQDFEFEEADISQIPFFNVDIENPIPESVAAFKERVKNADAVLFITPEHNRSIPGVLKNAIDWGSRPFGKGVWIKKPAAVLGASPSAMGAFAAQTQLRSLLSFLGAKGMYQPEIYLNFSANVDKEGNLSDSSKTLFNRFFAEFKSQIPQNA
ncbi:MAG: NAD(P)H-dependent oxidoreductase [Endomicrobium sp.]|jgi:chromate reductase|nr:NAD(P)H-dependent oxidoreductase [Endomicrobium sp.]